MAEQYDLAVIGAGPGGYVAAIRGAQLGFKTICIDKSALGGTCLNVGCIPSKALLYATECLARLKNEGSELGIACSSLSADFPHMVRRNQKIIKGLTDGIEFLFHQYGVAALRGTAEFLDAHRLKVSQEDGSQQEIEAKYIILATGSEPIPLPSLPFDEKQILSSTGALSLGRVPKRMVVIGGGVIGVEMASIFSRMGAKVTIVEMLDHLCTALDKDLSTALLNTLKKQNIEFWLNSQVVTAVVQPDEVILTIKSEEKLQMLNGDAVLVAVGRRPYTGGLHLERVGIQKDQKGFIAVDGNFRTAQPHIFAIGDIIEGTMLAHRASAEGTAVVEWINGGHPSVDYLALPNVVYTHPEVATIGLTEQEARQAGLELMNGKSFFRANSRGRCCLETEGFVKIIGEKRSGRLLGMHIIGSHASELIAEGMIAMQKKASVKDLADAPNAHPTLSETIKEAAVEALARGNE